MFEKKYIIIIGLIICLLVLYYFYDEITSIKKLFTPAYQKTMLLESRLLALEKKTNDVAHKRKPSNNADYSPALSITYQSDMVKNGNLSVKYADISDTEAKNLLQQIDNNKTKRTSNIPIENLSEAKSIPGKNISLPNKKLDFEESDTINVNIAELMRKNMDTTTNNLEYEKILNGLEKNRMCSNDVFDDDDEIDDDIVRNISESIGYADIASEYTLSEIPSTPKAKKSKDKASKKNSKQKNRLS